MGRRLSVLALLSCFALACSAGRNLWVGSLEVTGHEPFTELALVTDSGERYLLRVSEADREALQARLPARVQVRGRLEEGEWYGQKRSWIRVHSWKVVASSREP